jgi:hypothetical protein
MPPWADTPPTAGSSRFRPAGCWPLPHAAAIAGLDMPPVMRWVMLKDLTEAKEILDERHGFSPRTHNA